MSKELKAYEVCDDYEGNGCVVFATNSATARREGAGELGTTWEGVGICRRAPHLDQYAPGPVTPLTLIEHGWWFECQHCGRRVSNDMADEIEDDGLDSAGFVPRSAGTHGVFCSESCECADHMDKRGREEAAEALREVFEANFPGAKIDRIHAYNGPKLEAGAKGRYVVIFTFPGSSSHTSTWEFGDDFCRVPMIDQEAFKAWRGTA